MAGTVEEVILRARDEVSDSTSAVERRTQGVMGREWSALSSGEVGRLCEMLLDNK